MSGRLHFCRSFNKTGGKMTEIPEEPKYVSAAELLDKLFEEILTTEDFDAEIVALTRQHLGVPLPHSKAGGNLSEALIALANSRAEGEK
jgi:hypothetical protein